jgi:hypothetical protein
MALWHGEIVGSGQCPESRTRKITFAFEDESDAIKASRALEGLLGEYFKPKSSDDQSRMPRDLTSNQCSRSAEAIFDSFAERLGWDSQRQADVLRNWCGEGMIEPLLRHIQETGNAEDFEVFLIDNFGDDPVDSLSPTQTEGG